MVLWCVVLSPGSFPKRTSPMGITMWPLFPQEPPISRLPSRRTVPISWVSLIQNLCRYFNKGTKIKFYNSFQSLNRIPESTSSMGTSVSPQLESMTQLALYSTTNALIPHRQVCIRRWRE